MAHDLKMTVIAEGVEDLYVLKLLEELGCDHVQGHHFSRALQYDEFTQWLDKFDMSVYKQ